ncbi:DUF2798 domain-containing protein [Kaistia dalseonensis]|uniref:DUF2798 domain-containing protein n=1 Tax=Kaistia dalseonensis TaxID=410840 RepID=A0ABU0HDH0_9HYPH|nr:DUF2798 domain-containing protein [Kaistia dalseonensis]MCX5497730.1 DUF2798 domain-containing protein [Kaistia dalseonensis]MDQ0440374.1 hypothetical protein [Kaistia dalseonensis]
MTSSSSNRSFGKLPARYHAVAFPFILSIFMCGMVSAVSTLRGFGLTPDFLSRWGSAWLLSWFIAFPVLLMILPLVRCLVAAIVAAPAR